MKLLLLSAILLSLCLLVSCGGSPEPAAVAEPTVTPTSTQPPPTKTPTPAETPTPVPPTETPTPEPPTPTPLPPTDTPTPEPVATDTPVPTDTPSPKPPTATPTEAPPLAIPESRPNFDGSYFGYSDNWDDSLGWIGLPTGYYGPENWGEWKVEALHIKPIGGITGYGTVPETGARWAAFQADAGGKTITVKLVFEGTGANLFNLAVHEQGKPGWTKFMSNKYNPEEIIEIGRMMAVHCKNCGEGRDIPDEVRTGLVWTVGGRPK